MFTSLRGWLTRPVIEVSGSDRPFRLRRLSALLIVGGWVAFLVSCLIGTWLVWRNVPVLALFELMRFEGLTTENAPGLQVVRGIAQATGAVAFVGGMLSVALFDRRDRIPLWHLD